MVTEGHRGSCLSTVYESPEPPPSEELKRPPTCEETEDHMLNGGWSHRSISRSLQRAEALFRTTFNPRLKWLLRGHSQEEELEGGFVAAHNLVSRSSTRLLRLLQGMLGVAAQWQLIEWREMVTPQVCVKDLSQEGCVLLNPSSPTLQGHYGVLWRLLEQQSQLLLVHEYARRAHSAATYVSRLSRILKKLDLTPGQNQLGCSDFTVSLGPLSQELRVHLSHWSCLFSKAQSDIYLRHGLAKQPGRLAEMRQVLDSLGLQALVLMEHLVYVTLSHLAQTWFESVPREVLDDILAGTELYNQAVEEYRQYHSATLWRTVVLHQTDYYRLRFRSPSNKRCYPAAFPVKELMRILAIHHGKIAAKQLHHWASQQTYQCCEAHLSQKSQLYPEALPNQGAQLCCGASMWTWKQLEYSYPLITFNRPQPPCDSSLYPPPHSSLRPPPLLHSRHLLLNPHPNLDGSVLENVCPASTSVQQRPECPTKGQTRTNTDRKCQSYIGLTDSTQTDAKDLKSVQSSTGEPVPIQTSLIGCYEAQTNLNISEAFQTVLPPSHSPSFLPLSGFCQQDQSSLELLFQALVSSSDLLAPLVPQTSTTSSSCSTAELLVPKKFRADKMAPKRQTNSMSLQGTRTDSVAPLHIQTDSVVLNRLRTQRNPNLQICQQEQAEAEMTTRELSPSEGEPEEEKVRVEEEAPQEQELFGRPCSVQWLDLSQTSVCADLFAQYRAMLWPKCSQSFWLHLHFPPASGAVGSINLWNNCKRFQLLHILSQASKTGLVLKECSAMLEDFRLLLSVSTAHAHWDHVLCMALGWGLKDKCLLGSQPDSSASSFGDGSPVMTATMERFLQLPPPLLSSLHCHHSAYCTAPGPDGVCGSRLPLLQSTVSLALASVQTSTLWVMSKAYQFLSSWSLNKFLLITQGDLKVLRMSLESLLQQTETLIIDEDHVNQYHQHHQHHPLHQALLRQQIGALRKAVSKLQGFSSLALKIFSTDCKRMSEEIFEQTMPPAKHWRLSFDTGFPSSPSEYASLAAQSVIGQVLEGVAPLSDDARIQALSVTMTAFMEAWMEHILKQKIRFSIQGALQLKQDFDSIRELIQSDQYSLSTELHQRLLSLRVFQQVDSAVVCLLQQPQAKPYLQSTGLELCRRCCPTTGSRSSIDTAVGGSITNLESMEGEALNQFVPSLSTSDNPTAGPNPPGEPYLAPSFALGAAQQEWLDLRVHSSSARWRLPGFSCLSKSEP